MGSNTAKKIKISIQEEVFHSQREQSMTNGTASADQSILSSVEHITFVTLPLNSHGGAQRLIAEEIQYLNRNTEVSIITPDSSKDVLRSLSIPDEIEVRTYDVKGLLKDANKIRRELSELSPDLIFSHYKNKETYLALISKSNPPPVVTHVHGTLLWFPDHWGVTAHQNKECFSQLINSVPGHKEFRNWPELSIKNRLETRIAQYIEKRALHHSEGVFVDSNQVKSELKCLYNAHSEVVPPGISTDWVSSYDKVPNKQLTDEDHTILSISRLDSRKRLKLLLRAFGKIRKRRGDVGLVIGGKGELGDELEALAESIEVNDSVYFPGFIPERDLPSYYKSADVFACPGWMSFGITPLEAYGMRTPVAVSVDAFVKEAIGDLDGTRVLSPKAKDWARGIIELLKASSIQFDIDAIPTYEEYCENKFSSIEELLEKIDNCNF